MKIKSLTSVCLLSIAALASCGGGDVDGAVKNIKGGSKDEKQAIQDCIAYFPVAYLQGEGAITLNLTDTFDANPDDGQNLILAKKIIGVEVNMAMYNVDIEWDISSSTENVYKVTDINDSQILVDFAYSTSKNLPFSVGIKKISCGGAVSEDPQVKYNLNLKKIGYKHDLMPISSLNEIGDQPVEQKAKGEYGYKLIDYTKKDKQGKASPYWETNNKGAEKEYYYVDVNGEVIYTAPDGNWGLIADGDQVMEIYAGKALNILKDKYPDLEKKYVQVSANMSQYQGNIQLGFLTFVRESSAANKRTANKTYQTINGEFIDSITTKYMAANASTLEEQSVSKTMNEIATENEWEMSTSSAQKSYNSFILAKDGTLDAVKVAVSGGQGCSSVWLNNDTVEYRLLQNKRAVLGISGLGYEIVSAKINYTSTDGGLLTRQTKDSSGKSVTVNVNPNESFNVGSNELKLTVANSVSDGANGIVNVTGIEVVYKVLTLEGQLQCVPGKNLSNALVSVTGTYVPGSLSTGDKINKGARATFQLDVEGRKVTVAYDYHTDKEGTVGLCNNLNNAIASGKPITIKGTYRYNCSDSAPFIQSYSNPGHWEVVPFLAEHCVF